MNRNARTRYVVLVTGGSGTLGRHVVGLLQTRADHVTDIRVLDLQPFRNSPGKIILKSLITLIDQLVQRLLHVNDIYYQISSNVVGRYDS